MSAVDLQGISKKSCDVLQELGPKIQWLERYVTDNQIYCVYIALNEALVRKYAEMGEFPISAINEVKAIIDSVTAE